MHPLLPHLGRSRRTALRLGETAVTHAELTRLARAHAARMLAEGIAPGDRVAVWATPELPTVAAIAGNALMGVATVPLNPAVGGKELAHVLGDSAPRLVLAADPAPFRERTPSARAIALDGDGAGPGAATGVPAPDDPLLVLYTSGTTGPPKGAVLTHRNAAFDLDALAGAWGWTDDDVLVHALPLFHVHGLVLGVLGSLRVGGELHLLPRFTPEGVCAAMAQGGTMLFAVPTMYHRLAEHGEASPEDASSVGRACSCPARRRSRCGRTTGSSGSSGSGRWSATASPRPSSTPPPGTTARARPGRSARRCRGSSSGWWTTSAARWRRGRTSSARWRCGAPTSSPAT